MKKYRSKVVEIEAVQFDGSNPGIEGVQYYPFEMEGDREHEPFCVIETLEGEMTAKIGDWIIRGTEGEYYPCKDSVFQRKYEVSA